MLVRDLESNKPGIRSFAQQRLDGGLLKDFEAFLDFLHAERISLPWTPKYAFNAKYRGELAAKIYIDRDNAANNHLSIAVVSAKWDDLDDYLKMQSDEIAGLFFESIANNKCRRCSPNCSCSRAPEFEFMILGRQYDHPCFAFGRHAYHLATSGGGMREMLLAGAGDPARSVPIETVKELILARKRYIDTMVVG